MSTINTSSSAANTQVSTPLFNMSPTTTHTSIFLHETHPADFELPHKGRGGRRDAEKRRTKALRKQRGEKTARQPSQGRGEEVDDEDKSDEDSDDEEYAAVDEEFDEEEYTSTDEFVYQLGAFVIESERL